MKIAIDCRYIGKSGIGRVCEGIIDNLDYSAHDFYLIGNPKKLEKYSNATIIADETDPYSKRGILSFDKSLNKTCDAYIVPNFLIPFGVKIPTYCIMHDLIFLDLKMSTRGVIDRLIKKILLKRCMKKAKKIACVSAFTLSRCKYHYKKLAEKCFVDHIGMAKDVVNYNPEGIKKTNAVIFVGNVKEHKGIQTLIKAFRLLPKDEYVLKIIGEKDNFLTGMKEELLQGTDAVFTGTLTSEQLLKEIASARFLVQPSLYEGFGLPPAEALCLGTKPIISDIPVFKEVYSDFDVDFFKVNDENSLADAIMSANDKIENQKDKVLAKYNYKKFVATFFENII